MTDTPQRMTHAPAPLPPARVLGVALLLLGQLFCAVFFVGDVVLDALSGPAAADSERHLAIEALAAATLVASLAATVFEVRRLAMRQRAIEARLAAASGAFYDLLEAHFEAWGLTPSERDVALLAIKGLSIAEIAALRGTRSGTVKAQLGAIYAKAGVTGRPQLISLFVEEMLGGALAGRAG